MKLTELTGTAALIRLNLRRDRIVLPVWIACLVLSAVSTASMYKDLFPTVESRTPMVELIMSNPSLVALSGPIFGSSLGALTVWKIGVFGGLMVALMSLLIVMRHTRAEEEAGRRELIGSTVVGRHAPLTAGLIVAFGANLVLAVAMVVGLAGSGLPLAGSVAFGLSWLALGWVFTAVAAVTAQLTESASTARGMVGAFLGLCYVLRIVGDAANPNSSVSWLSWLSPVGWAQQMRPYADERWWTLALFACVTALSTVAAYALSARRDVGAGILPQRLGPATAAPSLGSPLALAWRLQRGSLLGWTIGYAAIGLVFGGVAQSVQDSLLENSQMRDLLLTLGGQSVLINAFFSATMSIMGLITAVYTIQATLRLKAEEETHRAELLLCTATSRWQWFASHLWFAIVGPVMLLVVMGLTTGLTYGLSVGAVGTELLRLLGSTLVQLPAIWIVTGITVALYGIQPRLTSLAWALLGLFLMLGQLGDILRLDKAVMNISPFTHTPKLPGGDVVISTLLGLLAVAALFTTAGLVGFRRRDVA